MVLGLLLNIIQKKSDGEWILTYLSGHSYKMM